MSLPIITPAEGQPIHALMRELEALGGVRHQDFKVVSGLARSAYQVTPELYQKWLEAGGAEAPAEPGPSDAEAADTAGDSNDPAAPEETTASETDTGDAETATAEEKGTAKTAAAKAATTKRGARN